MLFATSIKKLDVIPTLFKKIEFFPTNSLTFNVFSDEIVSVLGVASEMTGSYSVETSAASVALAAERTVSDGSNLRNQKLAEGINFIFKHRIFRNFIF